MGGSPKSSLKKKDPFLGYLQFMESIKYHQLIGMERGKGWKGPGRFQ